MSFEEELGWSLDLPEGWDAQDLDDAAVFSHPDGVGVLQVVGYQEDDPVTEDQLSILADQELDESLTRTRVTCGDFQGFTVSAREDGEFWKRWYLFCDRVAVVATYSCEDEARNQEIEAIDDLMNTLVMERG